MKKGKKKNSWENNKRNHRGNNKKEKIHWETKIKKRWKN
jgi:hypothetical protein